MRSRTGCGTTGSVGNSAVDATMKLPVAVCLEHLMSCSAPPAACRPGCRQLVRVARVVRHVLFDDVLRLSVLSLRHALPPLREALRVGVGDCLRLRGVAAGGRDAQHARVRHVLRRDRDVVWHGLAEFPRPPAPPSPLSPSVRRRSRIRAGPPRVDSPRVVPPIADATSGCRDVGELGRRTVERRRRERHGGSDAGTDNDGPEEPRPASPQNGEVLSDGGALRALLLDNVLLRYAGGYRSEGSGATKRGVECAERSYPLDRPPMLLVLAKGDAQTAGLKHRPFFADARPRHRSRRGWVRRGARLPRCHLSRPGPRLLVVGCAHRRPDDSLCDGRGAPALVPNPRVHRTGRSALRDCDSGAAAPDSRLLAVLRPCRACIGRAGAHAARRLPSHSRRGVYGLRRRRRLPRPSSQPWAPVSYTAPCTSSLPSACTFSCLGATTPSAGFWSLSLLPWGLSNR